MSTSSQNKRKAVSFFEELKSSLEEAVEIEKGSRKPARLNRYERVNRRGVTQEKLMLSREEPKQ